MHMHGATQLLAAAALLVAAACGSSVTGSDTGAGGAGATAGTGGTAVDPECYDACIAKALTAEQCRELCSTSSGKGGASGKTSSGSGTAGSGGYIDPELEKSCFECWDDNATGVCEPQYDTCKASLACGQLRDCPFACKGTPACFAECQEIIPSGIDPLAALVQRMACDPGAPCAQQCAGAVTLTYCK